MALMIPDAAGIYTEAEPPLVYDPAQEAYRDTEGHVYDPAMEAWQKVWPEHPEKLYLYRDGDECADVTEGWAPYALSWFGDKTLYKPLVTKSAESITVRQLKTQRGSLWTERPIDMTRYNVLRVHVISAVTGNGTGEYYGGPVSLLQTPNERKNAYLPDLADNGSEIVKGRNITKTDFVAELDLTNVSGNTYVAIGFDTIDGEITLVLDRIWLE